MQLSLRYFGDPILRRRAKEVPVINDEIKELVRQMERIMIQHRGAGLAAPQVGVSFRLFIFRFDEETEDGKIIASPLRVFINPKLSEPSRQENGMKEGCLSIPGVREEVWRPDEITIEALDIEGNSFKERLSGIEARCAMHENDHLNGTLLIDRLPIKVRTGLEQQLRALKKKYHPSK